MNDSELYERLCDELEFRVRNAAAHAFVMGKRRGGQDSFFVEEQITFGSRCIRNILDQELTASGGPATLETYPDG